MFFTISMMLSAELSSGNRTVPCSWILISILVVDKILWNCMVHPTSSKPNALCHLLYSQQLHSSCLKSQTWQWFGKTVCWQTRQHFQVTSEAIHAYPHSRWSWWGKFTIINLLCFCVYVFCFFNHDWTIKFSIIQSLQMSITLLLSPSIKINHS